MTIASSTRRCGVSLGLVLAVAAVASLVIAPTALAGKRVSSFLGSPTGAEGGDGGIFRTPEGVAINQAGAGGVSAGEFYVSDSRRIQEFTAAGVFVRAWGADVIKAGAPNDTGTGFEICDTKAPTPNLPTDCKAGLTGSGKGGEMASVGGIAVNQSTGDVFVVDHGNARIQKFASSGTFLASFGWDVVSGGVTTFEVCTVAANCQGGSAGANGGQLSGSSGGGAVDLAVGPTGSVYLADRVNRRIQQFGSTGAFVSAWGWDVVPTGSPGDAGIKYELCPPSSASVSGSCRAGAQSDLEDLGHFGAFLGFGGPGGIAVDSSGRVLASDEANNQKRIVRFTANGGAPELVVGSGLTRVTNLAVGAGDRIFAAARCSVELCQDLASPGEELVIEFDSTGVLQDIHMSDANLNVTGIAASLATGDVYIATGAVEQTGMRRVFVLDDDGAAPVPAVSVSGVSGVTPHEATFEGTVDPNGPPGIGTSYRFEYSKDGDTWASLEGTPLSPRDGFVPQNVNAHVADLEANSEYEVRIAAVKDFGATESVVSPAVSFTTPPSLPEVETLQAQSFTDTTAIVSGKVNPNNDASVYRFEYGPTTAYGQSVPVPPAQIDGGKLQYVAATLTGLDPETAYHFRIVAENVSGVAEGGDATFTTRGAIAETPPRAYEQVSSVHKVFDATRHHFNNNAEYWDPKPVSADGNTKIFEQIGATDESKWGGEKHFTLLARRTSTGWQITDTTVPLVNPYAGEVGAGDADAGAYASDLTSQVLEVWEPVVGLPELGLYMQDAIAGDTNLLVPVPSGLGGARVDGATDDLSHLVVTAKEVLSDDAGSPGTSVDKVYEIVDGDVRLVSRAPSGLPFLASSGVGDGMGNWLNATSEDGEHIFFSSPVESATATQIYRRDGGTSTLSVSPSKRTPADPLGPMPKIYLGATADQSAEGPATVFFASEEKLTNAATNANPGGGGLGDLYRYEINTDTLTNVSAETSDPNGAEVLGLVGHSSDGTWIYYVARGRVIPGEGEAGKPNLYAWHDDGSPGGETKLVGVLNDEACAIRTVGTDVQLGDGCNFNITPAGGMDGTGRTARVSADGKTLLFQSAAELTGYPAGGFSELYLFEAEANNGAGHVSCVSCDPSGSPLAGNTLVPGERLLPGLTEPVRSLSGDGRRVLFATPNSLLPADVNGKLDVYEWLQGDLALVSTGQSEDDSRFENASADGGTVFITTRQQLVGQDDDRIVDLYAARVGGGFASQNPPPPGVPCVGDACKPSSTPAPSQSGGGSSSFQGPGNVTPKKNKKARKKSRKRGHSKKGKRPGKQRRARR